ncbi:MAG TPA: EAL domain-containing protein [Pseudonocardia sp.]
MFPAPAAWPLPFREACELVVEHLKREVPLASWSVTRYEGERQVHLYVQDDAYGQSDGDSYAWSDSFCQHMVAGVAPQIAPDAMAVPVYAAVGAGQAMRIGAYIGVPIRGANGELFGTLCGLDPERQPGSLHDHAPLLNLCATLLSQILHADHLRLEAIGREAELHWIAFHDPVTGLPNRAMFLDVLGRALAEVGRRHALSLMLIDLDDFTSVNDVFGHTTGDGLLAALSRRLRTGLTLADTLARLGGDQFALLTDAPDHVAKAETIRKAFDEPFLVAGIPVVLSASVGVTVVSRDAAAESVDALLARAGIALYRAKRTGKARSLHYEPAMTMRGTRDVLLREPLRAALESGAVEAYYQAITDLRTGRPVGFEALARWHHNGEPISPDVFIPIAARSGLLPALTERMFDLACAQTAAWSRELGHHDLRVGVNVPAECVGDPDLPDRVAEHLKRHALRPHQLTLEVTEEALLADLEAAAAVTHKLRELDVRIVLDDFGRGFSSLLHLQTLPLQSIKIDRGFILDVDTNPETRQFMRALRNLSRDLELVMVVEGVERQEQADTLRELGCTYVQGHLYGLPAPPGDIDVHGG